ncbi:hypothetical protein E4U41_000059 [Claviceps citrina]|nr:hypothetical protein E4U41_000059 [Claviceps citrina]
MPLHLLGKKSWNVYNADNIARVRRDEAAARAAEEAEEQRMQEIDAQRRLAILRGEQPLPPAATEEKVDDAAATKQERSGVGSGRPRRKRKREGEDDTDFELRLARERTGAVAATSSAPEARPKKPSSSAPIVDDRGHFDLFGDEKTRAHAEKNEEAEREAREKKRAYEDQYTMRLANAAGKDGVKEPWYSRAGAADEQVQPLRDIWGKEDPRRKQRDAARIAASDPLAMMKKGASRVRELKEERRKVQEERDEDLRQMRNKDKRQERHGRKHVGESGRRSASPASARRRRRSRERKEDSHERDRDRGRERRRHDHSHHLDDRGSRKREQGHDRPS